MNIQTLRLWLANEEQGEPFSNPELEEARQKHIAWIVDQIIEENRKALEAFTNKRKAQYEVSC